MLTPSDTGVRVHSRNVRKLEAKANTLEHRCAGHYRNVRKLEAKANALKHRCAVHSRNARKLKGQKSR